MKPKSLKRRGFTLIELLTVVAIISLLIAILLPSLHRAKTKTRDTQCLNRLRSIMLATSMYLGEESYLPALNNDPDEGAWQYNYLIWDGRDYEHCFGPLGKPTGIVKYTEQLYCPVQTDPFHMLSTNFNPWPAIANLDTRAGYGRRYGLSGKAFTQFRRIHAYAADLMHLPEVVKSAHKKGVNVVYTDGHAQFVRDPGILTDNELASPFDPLDNPIVKDIWRMLDKAGRGGNPR